MALMKMPCAVGGGIKTAEEIPLAGGGSTLSAEWDFDAKCFILTTVFGTSHILMFDLVDGQNIWLANTSAVWQKASMSVGAFQFTEKTPRKFTLTTTLTFVNPVVIPLAEYPTGYDFS